MRHSRGPDIRSQQIRLMRHSNMATAINLNESASQRAKQLANSIVAKMMMHKAAGRRIAVLALRWGFMGLRIR